MNVQEGRLEQAQDALRQIRAAGSRRSKEARWRFLSAFSSLVTCFQMLTKLGIQFRVESFTCELSVPFAFLVSSEKIKLASEQAAVW